MLNCREVAGTGTLLDVTASLDQVRHGGDSSRAPELYRQDGEAGCPGPHPPCTPPAPQPSPWPRKGVQDHRDWDAASHWRNTGARTTVWPEAEIGDCDAVVGLKGNQQPVPLALVPSVAGVARRFGASAQGRGCCPLSPPLLPKDGDNGVAIVMTMASR